jgi:hypothetical protein
MNIRWIAFVILAAVFALYAAVNAYCLILQFNAGDKPASPSLAPLLGGVAGVLALLVMPVGTISGRAPWLWVPIIADTGTGYYFIGGTIALLIQRGRVKKTQQSPARDSGKVADDLAGTHEE